MEEPLIDIRNVSKVYDSGTVGLKNINLTIKKGEFVVVVGLSGAGKSTLLRTINRMHDVTDGDILIEGKSIITIRERNCGNYGGKSGWSSKTLIGKTVIRSTQRFVRKSWLLLNVEVRSGAVFKEDKQKAVDALKQVKMADKIYSRADELSGGQQQRVAIARALMQDPKIMLADEPIASLDPLTTKAVMDELKELNRKLGITVIVNLHSVPLAMQYADRIVGLRAGQLVYDKPIEEVQEADFDSIYEGAAKQNEWSTEKNVCAAVPS